MKISGLTDDLELKVCVFTEEFKGLTEIID